MPNRALLEGTVGSPQINEFYISDATQRFQMGEIVSAADPYWGGGEFMYVYFAATSLQYSLVTIVPTFDSTLNRFRWDALRITNAANLGEMVGVAMVPQAAGNYGWVCIQGIVPIAGNASVAADTSFGITGSGLVGAVTAGKQILNGRIALPASTTVVKANCQAPSGSNQLQVPSPDGWFIGAYLSGTGIAGGTTVLSIDPSGHQVTLSAVTTAAVAGSVTATYNNGTIFYNVATINRPFAQGQIL